MDTVLAEFNVARLRRPLDDAENAEFVAALDPVNAIAESSPGFVWRLVDDDGGSSSYVRVPGIDDPLLIVNMSVWTDVESLRHYVTRSGHAAYLRRRREWFERPDGPVVVCWWMPAGELPSPADGQRRLEHLRDHGPSAEGWHLHDPFPRPGTAS